MSSKITFLQILSLILISFVLLISFKPITTKKHKKVNKSENIALYSERLTKGDAEILRNNYRNSPYILRTIDNGGNQVTMEIITFDASAINEILAKVNSSAGTQDKVVFKFGFDNQNRRRFIVYGMTNNGLLEYPDQTGRHSIFYNSDYAPQSMRKRKDEADMSRSLYERRNPLTTIDKSGNEIELLGFSFNADHINEILNYNASGEKQVNKLVLYLGLEPVRNKMRWHAIAYGMKGNALLDYASGIPLKGHGGTFADVGTFASIFDKADPCPPCK
jgi:hypothetical protein